ncbi:uncharacterized protein LOC104442150 [Eucalyptus grandis]|uniref:uncharacterized protein LOC104442150 n=1 Tax=Eucalyptus grandis TaxID=71139 RepID=UPI00192E7DE7|nr:uncharacterized protein LOC104442150 [Eucalyptus grandis]
MAESFLSSLLKLFRQRATKIVITQLFRGLHIHSMSEAATSSEVRERELKSTALCVLGRFITSEKHKTNLFSAMDTAISVKGGGHGHDVAESCAGQVSTRLEKENQAKSDLCFLALSLIEIKSNLS